MRAAALVVRAACIALLCVTLSARADEPPKFSHLSHAKRTNLLQCSKCHGLADKTYAPRAPIHDACNDAACHGPRLSNNSDGKSLCGGCHDKAQNWAATPARLAERADKERDYGWRFDHRRHLQLPGLGCDNCHALTKSLAAGDVKVAVHTPGHADCAPCHGKEGSSPRLTDCGSCHVAGPPPRPRPHDGELTVWRVNALFKHETHRLDVRTARVKPGGVGRGWSRYDAASAATLGCGACHQSAARADNLADMDLLGPCAMSKTCMGQCHNGKLAFQGSGTNMRDCLLCHTGVDDKTPAPASHCGL